MSGTAHDSDGWATTDANPARSTICTQKRIVRGHTGSRISCVDPPAEWQPGHAQHDVSCRARQAHMRSMGTETFLRCYIDCSARSHSIEGVSRFLLSMRC